MRKQCRGNEDGEYIHGRNEKEYANHDGRNARYEQKEVEDEKKNDTRTKGVKPWDKPGYVKRDPKMCPNFKIVVYHKPERCLELETNK